MRKGFWKEAAVVGGSTVAIAGVVNLALKAAGYGAKGYGAKDAEKAVHWIPIAFATGVLTHVAWEALGGNRWFAENYVKTLPSANV